MSEIIPIDNLLNAYAHGSFPMAEGPSDQRVEYFAPLTRGQLPILELYISSRLERFIRNTDYTVTINQDFEGVIDGCADPTRDGAWINSIIRDTFIEAHKQGHAHSVEYRLDGELMGGLYGLSVGGVFCGESMFSRSNNASKVALVHLCARLVGGAYNVLDVQMTTPMTEKFGAYEISRSQYLDLLMANRDKDTDFIQSGVTEDQLLSRFFEARKALVIHLPRQPQSLPQPDHPYFEA